MGITRDSPLLTTAAQVVDLTGVQDLLNLEADAEFSVADTPSKFATAGIPSSTRRGSSVASVNSARNPLISSLALAPQ